MKINKNNGKNKFRIKKTIGKTALCIRRRPQCNKNMHMDKEILIKPGCLL